jgi:hypothetical protein
VLLTETGYCSRLYGNSLGVVLKQRNCVPINAWWKEKLPENNESVTLIFGTLDLLYWLSYWANIEDRGLVRIWSPTFCVVRIRNINDSMGCQVFMGGIQIRIDFLAKNQCTLKICIQWHEILNETSKLPRS